LEKLDEDDVKQIRSLLTFNSLPTKAEIEARAEALAELAQGYPVVMIGGAPYLMSALEQVLKSWGSIPVYAFSERESVEHTLPDGSVRKTNIFRHKGFVQV